ncbi:MAG TPA: hypothetical protein DD381_10890 [Lentisphaeria bacterium]|nr:MAG: hypothetical protein A2X47_00710 [Lentisphaerae bacterium GWF2_38_69]HBM16833.1 hypothetical protein [Lentisphaeria bacterium]
MKEWFKNEDLWKALEPFLFSEKRIAAAADEVQAILNLTGKNDGMVLDLCCGIGRHSIQFAKNGFSVTGVDTTSIYLEKAKAEALKEKVEVEWILQDARKFIRPDYYDLVINMYTSFGYSENQSDDLEMLSNIFRSLKSKGFFIMDLMGKEIVAKMYRDTISETLPDGTLLVQKHHITDSWGRIRNHWILIKDHDVRHMHLDHWLYSGQELKRHLEDAGFKKISLLGSLNGSEYGISSNRLIIIAQKD